MKKLRVVVSFSSRAHKLTFNARSFGELSVIKKRLEECIAVDAIISSQVSIPNKEHPVKIMEAINQCGLMDEIKHVSLKTSFGIFDRKGVGYSNHACTAISNLRGKINGRNIVFMRENNNIKLFKTLEGLACDKAPTAMFSYGIRHYAYLLSDEDLVMCNLMHGPDSVMVVPKVTGDMVAEENFIPGELLGKVHLVNDLCFLME